MRTISIRLADMPKITLNIGFVGESVHTKVSIDCKKIFDDYPDAEHYIMVMPPVGEAYTVTSVKVGDNVEWDVGAADLTSEGNGQMQITFTDNGEVIKSYVAKTHVNESIIPGGGGGGGGMTDYEDLNNKPQIGGVTLTGNKLPSAFGIHSVPAGGSADQVLAKNSATDYDLKWVDQSGGGGGAEIDDTAGEGDTDVVWSANKTWTEKEGLKEAIATEAKSSTADGVDLDIADPNGNVLLRLNDGNIRTKKFNSDNGVYEKTFSYTNTAGTQTIDHFFPAGTRLAFHFINNDNRARDSIRSDTVTYKYTDTSGTAHTIFSDIGYNYPEYTLTEDAVSVTVAYGTGLNWGENASLSFMVFSMGDVPRKPIVLTVGTGKMYTNLRTALEYAEQRANEKIRYEVHLYPGTYNVLSYYTAEEIAAENFYGLFVTNGVSLIGIGQRPEIILTATMSTADYNETKRNDVATLNIYGNVTVKNVTIKAENIRYAVHDDTGMLTEHSNIHYFEDVTFYGENLTSGGGGQRSYGAGGGNMKKLYFKNCDFSDNMVIHSTTGMSHEFTSVLENCRSRAMSFSDYDSSIKSHVYLKNCNVGRIIFTKSSGEHDQFMQLEGEGTDNVMVFCPAGYVYALGGVHKFFGSNVTAGKGVKLNAAMTEVSAADSIDSLYGISIGVANGATYVQTEGWINSNTLGLSNLSVGDYLTINTSTGAVEVGTSSNAIAQVRHVDSDGVAYAKLM